MLKIKQPCGFEALFIMKYIISKNICFLMFFSAFLLLFQEVSSLTDAERTKIIEMRSKGIGYKAIGSKLGMSRDAVRRFCKNNNLTGYGEAVKINHDEMAICPNCGKALEQPMRGRPKKFCSDKCRLRWWNDNFSSHRLGMKTTCAECGRSFMSSPSSKRKYCSHECYIKSRFGGKQDD